MGLYHSDHDYDPETGDPTGWTAARGDLVGAVFVLLVLAVLGLGVYGVVRAVMAMARLVIGMFG